MCRKAAGFRFVCAFLYLQHSDERVHPLRCTLYGDLMYTKEERETGALVRQIALTSGYGWNGFYHTRQWKDKRLQILKRDHYACQVCKRLGKYKRGNIVHHRKHLKDAPELALTDSNLETICRECHEKMHPDNPFYRNKHRVDKDERW